MDDLRLEDVDDYRDLFGEAGSYVMGEHRSGPNGTGPICVGAGDIPQAIGGRCWF